VAGRKFGWRQPAGVVALGCIAVGLVPAVLTLTDGSWFTPRTTLVDAVDAQLPTDPETGDYRVLYLGDPRLLPVPVEDLGDGVSIAEVDDGALDLRDRWTAPEQDADAALADVIDQIRSSSTLRGGRLLAPFGVRFIVVPFVDGANSTASEPLPVPAGLLDALGTQLDIALRYSPPNLAVFENRAAIPTTARLDGELADASRRRSPDELVAVDTSGAEPTMIGVDESRRAEASVEPGVLHLGVPLDEAWELDVNGAEVAGRTGFGVTTAYDVTSDGSAELQYRSPASRGTWLIVLGALWIVALVAASRVRVPARLRPSRPAGETLIDLDSEARTTGTTGAETWVDELLSDEEAATVRREGTRP
jgi:hypothetical protein